MAREEVLISSLARLPDHVTWKTILPLGTWASKPTESKVIEIERENSESDLQGMIRKAVPPVLFGSWTSGS